ncbi:uncharacterized protein UTRI_03535_B [Ustilago trichophora]|uniref:RlpA-like protein double-psi beta-barrel domain-containing protein n=1 Tax=Ustilago trichophora TaxID=86804 RepID=A0A5C3E1K5_9BASI|nr:uncharacterized protein UTRI_03535_B [Ustilago trichophora]
MQTKLSLLLGVALALLITLTSAEKLILPSPEHIGTPEPHISDTLASFASPRLPEAAEQPHIEKRRHHGKPRSKTVSNGKITYYFGSQLLNPACPDAPTPNDGSMTAAISYDSPFKCGDKIKITDSHGKHATVTVVDRCAGCTYNWIDVTKGVFKVFSDLDAGVLRDVTFSKQ